MENLAASIFRSLSALEYQHREGGRYSYVKFLSLVRDLPELLAVRDAGAELIVAGIQERMNLALEETFTGSEEAYFYQSRSVVLRLLQRAFGSALTAPPALKADFSFAGMAKAVAAL